MTSRTDERSALPSGMVPIEADVARRAEYLDDSLLVRGLEWTGLEKLARYWRAFRAEAGITILQEGTTTPLMALLVHGRLRAEKLDSSGTARELAQVRPGRIIGEMAMLDGEPASASVVAVQDSDLLVLTGPAFRKLCADSPELALPLVATVARLLSQKLRATSGRMVDLL